MTRFWIAVSGGCGVIALILLLQRNFDIGFIVAVTGAVAWFLSYRAQIKTKVDLANGQDQSDEDMDLDEE